MTNEWTFIEINVSVLFGRRKVDCKGQYVSLNFELTDINYVLNIFSIKPYFLGKTTILCGFFFIVTKFPTIAQIT